MKNYSIAELKVEFDRLKYKWFSFHIVGIRSASNEPNKFDDLIGIVADNTIKWFKATTNAGTYWLLNPSNVNGTAVLKCGQYIDSWAMGLHQGKYKALRQIKPVTVYRDGDHDAIAEEEGKLDTGMFGINIHRANETATSVNIDKWSAGCQVIANGIDYKQFINTCEKSKINFFTYTLLKEF